MLKGFISAGRNSFGYRVSIRIEGYPEADFYGYSVTEVKRIYKAHHYLDSRHVKWIVSEGLPEA